MKILQILPALEQGGSELDAVELALTLRAGGIENGIVSTGGGLVARVVGAGVVHYELPVATKNVLRIILNAARLARIIKRDGYDLVHARSRAPAWSVRIAALLTGVRWVTTFHGFYSLSPRFFKLWYNGVMLAGARTICVSEAIRRHVEESYRTVPGQLVTISDGVDLGKFSPASVTREMCAQYRSLLGFDSAVPLVVMVGRLARLKGQMLLLEALVRMRRRPLGALFVGRGSAAYRQELQARARELPPELKVVFIDASDNLPLVYATADVVVNASSSRPEAFGRVIVEAQAMGTAVVATAHGGACEIIEDGKTGFLVPPGDADSLARKLDEALDMSDDARGAMRAAAIRSVSEKFTCELNWRKTLALYREVLDSQGKVPSWIARVPFVGLVTFALCAILGLDRKRG